MPFYLLKYGGVVLNADNEEDRDRLVGAGADLLEPSLVDSVFGDLAKYASPATTSIDSEGGIVFTPPDIGLDSAAVVRHDRAKKMCLYDDSIAQLSRWLDDSTESPAAQAHYKTQRTAWHTWADALCDLPDQPGWPWPGGDVPWPEQPPKPTRYSAP